MDGPLAWFAAVGAAFSAALIAGDLGRRPTGYAFLLFCAVSIAWIAAALLDGSAPLLAQNAVMLAINAYGAWQFLINPRKKREIDQVERCARQLGEDAS